MILLAQVDHYFQDPVSWLKKAVKALAPGGKIVITNRVHHRTDGLEALRQLRAQAPTLPVLVMSGYSELETSTRLAGLGASGFIQKPFHPRDLLTSLSQLIQ